MNYQKVTILALFTSVISLLILMVLIAVSAVVVAIG